jgi:hypothetical protein
VRDLLNWAGTDYANIYWGFGTLPDHPSCRSQVSRRWKCDLVSRQPYLISNSSPVDGEDLTIYSSIWYKGDKYSARYRGTSPLLLEYFSPTNYPLHSYEKEAFALTYSHTMYRGL